MNKMEKKHNELDEKVLIYLGIPDWTTVGIN